MSPRLLGLGCAGFYLGLSYWTMRNMVLDGEIPHIRKGKKILIDLQDLDRWINREKINDNFN